MSGLRSTATATRSSCSKEQLCRFSRNRWHRDLKLPAITSKKHLDQSSKMNAAIETFKTTKELSSFFFDFSVPFESLLVDAQACHTPKELHHVGYFEVQSQGLSEGCTNHLHLFSGESSWSTWKPSQTNRRAPMSPSKFLFLIFVGFANIVGAAKCIACCKPQHRMSMRRVL